MLCLDDLHYNDELDDGIDIVYSTHFEIEIVKVSASNSVRWNYLLKSGSQGEDWYVFVNPLPHCQKRSVVWTPSLIRFRARTFASARAELTPTLQHAVRCCLSVSFRCLSIYLSIFTCMVCVSPGRSKIRRFQIRRNRTEVSFKSDIQKECIWSNPNQERRVHIHANKRAWWTKKMKPFEDVLWVCYESSLTLIDWHSVALITTQRLSYVIHA